MHHPGTIISPKIMVPISKHLEAIAIGSQLLWKSINKICQNDTPKEPNIFYSGINSSTVGFGEGKKS